MDFEALKSAFVALPIDWVIIAVFAIIASFDAMRKGPGRISALALALPVALLLTSAFPRAAFLEQIATQASTPLLSAVVFLIFAVALFFLLRRMDTSYGIEYGQPLQSVLAGCAATAILVVVWLEVPALQSLWQFGDDVQKIFGEGYRFWWLISSYASLAFVRN